MGGSALTDFIVSLILLVGWLVGWGGVVVGGADWSRWCGLHLRNALRPQHGDDDEDVLYRFPFPVHSPSPPPIYQST